MSPLHITITAHFALPATAALTGRMTLASPQPELTNCASLLSPREGQSVTHCPELEEERLLEVADTFGVVDFHELLFLSFLLVKSIPPTVIRPPSNHNVVFFKSKRKNLCAHISCSGKTVSYHSGHPSRKES